MAQGSSIRGPVVLGLLFATAACTGDLKVEVRVNPERGATQPEVDLGGGDATLSEEQACSMLLEAHTQTENDLGCDSERETDLMCPQFLRASAPGCAEYARNTVEECVDAVRSYDRCEDFRERPCIVSALESAGCGADAPDAAVDPSDGGTSDAAVP